MLQDWFVIIYGHRTCNNHFRWCLYCFTKTIFNSYQSTVLSVLNLFYCICVRIKTWNILSVLQRMECVFWQLHSHLSVYTFCIFECILNLSISFLLLLFLANWKLFTRPENLNFCIFIFFFKNFIVNLKQENRAPLT